MNKLLYLKKASTLIEVLVSVAVVLIFIVAAVTSLLNSQFLASISKHKLQAMYVAQQILEQERRLSFANITTQPSLPVTLDTNGTYNTTADDFLGNRIITVINLDAYRKGVQLQINWKEQVLANKVTMAEYYSTNITNDPSGIPN